jgi:hypothetical protein
MCEQELCHVEVAVHDGPGERDVQDTLHALHAPLARILVDPDETVRLTCSMTKRFHSPAPFACPGRFLMK